MGQTVSYYPARPSLILEWGLIGSTVGHDLVLIMILDRLAVLAENASSDLESPDTITVQARRDLSFEPVPAFRMQKAKVEKRPR